MMKAENPYSTTVSLACVLHHDEDHWQDGYSAETAYHRAVAQIGADPKKETGWVKVAGRCSVCHKPVVFDAEQQRMLWFGPSAVQHADTLWKALRPGIGYWVMSWGLMFAGLILALFSLLGLYLTPNPNSGIETRWHPDTFWALLIIGVATTVAAFFLRSSVRRDRMSRSDLFEFRAGNRSVLVSEELADKHGLPREAAEGKAALRRVGLPGNQTAHMFRFRGDEPDEDGTWYQGILKITGEGMGYGPYEIERISSDSLVELGVRVGSGLPPKEGPSNAIVEPGDIGPAAALLLAALFSLPLPFIATWFYEVSDGTDQPGRIAALARDFGLWDTFVILFVSIFPIAAAVLITGGYSKCETPTGRQNGLLVGFVVAYFLFFWFYLNPWFQYENFGDIFNMFLVGVFWCGLHLMLGVAFSILNEGPRTPER